MLSSRKGPKRIFLLLLQNEYTPLLYLPSRSIFFTPLDPHMFQFKGHPPSLSLADFFTVTSTILWCILPAHNTEITLSNLWSPIYYCSYYPDVDSVFISVAPLSYTPCRFRWAIAYVLSCSFKTRPLSLCGHQFRFPFHESRFIYPRNI